MTKIKTPIILIGFKYAGKSAIGAKLAQILNMSFTDLDRVIENHYSDKTGIFSTCRKIAQTHGIEYFRTLEAEMLQQVMCDKPCVLAVGGGTPIKTCNQRLIRQGTVIYVQSPKGRVFERIMCQGRPAFFPEGEEAYDAFLRTWAEREPIYNSLAQYHIQNTGTITEAVQQILSHLKLEAIA